MRLLILDDEVEIGSNLQFMLQESGFDVDYFDNARDAYIAATHDYYDLMIIDISLEPRAQYGALYSGMDVVRSINEKKKVPYIYLTARADPLDVTQGLYSGAEDYVTKPYTLSVLIARIRTVMRRLNQVSEQPVVLTCRDLKLDLIGHKVLVKGKEVPLTKKQFDVLTHLLKHKNCVVSRKQLAKEVWGYDGKFLHAETNTIDVTMKRLRSLIPKGYIKTIRGVGYAIEE